VTKDTGDTDFQDRTLESDCNPEGRRTDAVVWDTGSIILDEYLIEARIGRGGMGVVYRVSTVSEPVHIYAVKALLPSTCKNPANRRMFMRELRNWINLPGHTNIAPCRFFRTVKNQIVIFSEYFAVGSLHEWIKNGRIKTLRDALDVSIQMARGIQVAHDHGLIHRDIKPANVLMTEDGVAKLTDFGLAVTKEYTPASGTITLTQAYCSPEQVDGSELTFATDMWSWGVSVLELFAGTVFWRFGILAPSMLKKMEDHKSAIPMPPEITVILRRCFKMNPDDRWSSMDEIAGMLISLWHDYFDEDYHRTVDFTVVPKLALSDISSQVQLPSAHEQLLHAIKVTGRNKDDYEYYLCGTNQPSDFSMYFELEIFDEIDRLYNSIPSDKMSMEIRRSRAFAMAAKATIQYALNDLHGARKLYIQAANQFMKLIQIRVEQQLIFCLTGIMGNRANIEIFSGKNHVAVELYDKIVMLLESITQAPDETDNKAKLATALINRAIAQEKAGNSERALEDYDRAITIRRKIVESDPTPENRNALAGACFTQAAILSRADRDAEALVLYEKAEEIREILVFQENKTVFMCDLAVTLQNKAVSMRSIGDNAGALKVMDKSIELHERGCRNSIGDALAIAWFNRGNLIYVLEGPEKALQDYNRAVVTLENQIFAHGKYEILHHLARVYRKQAQIYVELAQKNKAAVVLDKAIKILTGLVERKGRVRFKEELDHLRRMKESL